MSLALGLGLGPSYGGGVAFSPLALFAAGEAGFWYAPGTISTLFQDAAGTTAVAAAADPDGLVLDRSKSLLLGSEVVTTGDFSSSTGWTLNGVSIAGGKLVASAAANGSDARQTGKLTAGAFYQVTYDIDSISGGSVRFFNLVTTGPSRSAPGTYTEIFTGTGTALGLQFLTLGVTASIDNLSVKLLSGNHAVLSGATTLRPLYQITPARLVFDATDDRLLTTLNPTTSGTIAARIKGGTASKVALGSQGASNGRAFLALAADGSLGAGIGADSTSTIKGSADIRAAWATGVVTWDGSTVKLYQDGAQVYSGAQNGAVNTTVPWMFGCLNNNATAASFWDGSIGAALVLDRAMTASEVSSLTSTWSSIQ